MIRKLAMLTVFLSMILILPSYSKTIPKFLLKDENGNIISQKSLKGKPSVLIFWGINCSSCKKELPIFNKFYKKYKNKINFYAIIIDSDDIGKIQDRKKKWGFEIPVLIGDKMTAYKFKIFGVPITYFVDKNLEVKKILIGRASEKQIEKEIKNLFN